MSLKNKSTAIVVLVFSFFAMVSCKNNTKKSATDSADKIVVPEQKDTVKIALSADDSRHYNVSEIHVYAGQTIILTFTHKGTAPVGSMGHNFTLLKKGASVSRLAQEAAEFVNNDYIPKNPKWIIAHTRLLGGGESDTITFQAPPKGKYDFICTFPGHYTTMHGKFIVH